MMHATGNPISVRQSRNKKELIVSASKLTLKMMVAVQYPQSLQRHKPHAADTHARHTVGISKTDECPIAIKPSWAWGLRRQSQSIEVPGTINIAAARPDARAPKKKKIERAVIPIGRGDRCAHSACQFIEQCYTSVRLCKTHSSANGETFG